MGWGYLTVLRMPAIGRVTTSIGMFTSFICYYFLTRFLSFVDHDMLMRFHWGLGVGHVYTHQQLCTNKAMVWSNSQSYSSWNDPDGTEPSDQTGMEEDAINSGMGTDGSGSESDDSDYKLSEGDEESSSDDDDEHLLHTHDMYGSLDSDDASEGF